MSCDAPVSRDDGEAIPGGGSGAGGERGRGHRGVPDVGSTGDRESLGAPAAWGGLRGVRPFSPSLGLLRSSEPDSAPGHPLRPALPRSGHELVPQGSPRLAAPSSPFFPFRRPR